MYYAGNYIYKKGSAQSPVTLTLFNSEEGYIEPVFKSIGVISDFDYVYQYKDHLGNIRLSYQDMDDNGTFNFEEKGVVGETIIAIGDKHSAIYFGTDKNGNAYFLSKHNKGGYTIDTYDQIIEKYKGKESDVNVYSIKKNTKTKN